MEPACSNDKEYTAQVLPCMIGNVKGSTRLLVSEKTQDFDLKIWFENKACMRYAGYLQ